MKWNRQGDNGVSRIWKGNFRRYKAMEISRRILRQDYRYGAVHVFWTIRREKRESFARASHTSLFSRTLFSGTHPCFIHKIKEPLLKWFFYFRAGKGIDSSPVSRALARAGSSLLRASRPKARVPKQLVRTSCISLFSRTLFSGPYPCFKHKIKETL